MANKTELSVHYAEGLKIECHKYPQGVGYNPFDVLYIQTGNAEIKLFFPGDARAIFAEAASKFLSTEKHDED